MIASWKYKSQLDKNAHATWVAVVKNESKRRQKAESGQKKTSSCARSPPPCGRAAIRLTNVLLVGFLAAAVCKDVRVQQPQGLSHGLAIIDRFQRGINALERADQLHALSCRYVRSSAGPPSCLPVKCREHKKQWQLNKDLVQCYSEDIKAANEMRLEYHCSQ